MYDLTISVYEVVYKKKTSYDPFFLSYGISKRSKGVSLLPVRGHYDVAIGLFTSAKKKVEQFVVLNNNIFFSMATHFFTE